MNMNSFWDKRFLNSEEAEKAAEELIRRINNRELIKDTLPNSYSRYTGDLEEKDFISYCKFLNSSNGKKLLNNLEEENARTGIRL